ncbi:MAG: hypothetical protein WCG36_02980, partial [bacterium]
VNGGHRFARHVIRPGFGELSQHPRVGEQRGSIWKPALDFGSGQVFSLAAKTESGSQHREAHAIACRLPTGDVRILAWAEHP